MTAIRKLRQLPDGRSIYLTLDAAGNQVGRLTCEHNIAVEWANAHNLKWAD